MAGFFTKLKDGLKKTRNSWFDTIFGEDRISDEFYEELEESMILADMGVETSTSLVEALREAVKTQKLKNRSEAREVLISLIAQRVAPEGPFPLDEQAGVILIVGVNGVGKTTSIGKIAHEWRQRGGEDHLHRQDRPRVQVPGPQAHAGGGGHLPGCGSGAAGHLGGAGRGAHGPPSGGLRSGGGGL